MALTFSGLEQAIKDYVENDSTEFDAAIPVIIGNAELKIYREIDLNVFRKYCTSTIAAGRRFLEKPDDYVVDRWIKGVAGSDESSGTQFDILPKDTSFIQTFSPNPSTQGQPRFYADWDDNTFILGPSADAAYTLVLAYTYRPIGLSASNTTSWLGDNAQDLLLAASLVQSYAFMKLEDENNPNLNFWMNEYDRALAALRLEEEKRQRTEELRHGERR